MRFLLTSIFSVSIIIEKYNQDEDYPSIFTNNYFFVLAHFNTKEKLIDIKSNTVGVFVMTFS